MRYTSQHLALMNENFKSFEKKRKGFQKKKGSLFKFEYDRVEINDESKLCHLANF